MKARFIFQDCMEAAVNKAVLFNELVKTADLQEVFGDRPEAFSDRLKDALSSLLTELTDSYFEAMEITEKESQQADEKGKEKHRRKIERLLQVVNDAPEDHAATLEKFMRAFVFDDAATA